MKLSAWVAASLLLALGLLVAAFVLAISNPTISRTSEGNYTCLAPYDHVFLGADNLRGDHVDGPDIADRCDKADLDRFAMACVLAGVSAVVGAGVAAVLVRRTRSA